MTWFLISFKSFPPIPISARLFIVFSWLTLSKTFSWSLEHAYTSFPVLMYLLHYICIHGFLCLSKNHFWTILISSSILLFFFCSAWSLRPSLSWRHDVLNLALKPEQWIVSAFFGNFAIVDSSNNSGCIQFHISNCTILLILKHLFFLKFQVPATSCLIPHFSYFPCFTFWHSVLRTECRNVKQRKFWKICNFCTLVWRLFLSICATVKWLFDTCNKIAIFHEPVSFVASVVVSLAFNHPRKHDDPDTYFAYCYRNVGTIALK